MQVEFTRVGWPFVSTFRISYRTQTVSETVHVKLVDGKHQGRGEGLPVTYHGETVDSMLAQLETVRVDLVNGVSRDELRHLLPAGGARNAIDCALWDLEAKRAGRRAWEFSGMSQVHPLITAYTIGIDTPEIMGQSAASARRYSLLKIKLAGDDQDLERVNAVRSAHATADIIVDANQSWDEARLRELTPRLADLGVKLIEQPLPIGKDQALSEFERSIPVCADESCQTLDSIPSLVGKYDYANIKLDKTGGLTEGLLFAQAAQKAGLKLMIGCMGGSSLSMAPAFIVGQLCAIADLDSPLLKSTDIAHGIRYEGSRMFAPQTELWG